MELDASCEADLSQVGHLGTTVSGVGGYVAGGHGLLSADAGCVVGRHMTNKKAKQDAPQSPDPQAPAKK